MKKLHFSILLVIIVMMSCSFPVNESGNDDIITVTDFRGKKIALGKQAENVVCLIESALTGLYMLNQNDVITGIPAAVYEDHLYTFYSQLDRRIKDRSLTAPGNWDFVSIEQVVGLNPDLVIIWASQTEAINSLEQFGIPVYAVMLNSFDDVYKEITDFGILMGCSERADSIIQLTKNNLASINQQSYKANAKSAYFMWSQGISETSGTNSTVNELLNTAGVKNACDLKAEHVTVNIEKIYDWNPDMIVMWYNERLDPEDVLNNPLLQGIEAVMNGNVYELPQAFSCDFWTLKMQYPVWLIYGWANSINGTPDVQNEMLNKMYLQLYGTTLN